MKPTPFLFGLALASSALAQSSELDELKAPIDTAMV